MWKYEHVENLEEIFRIKRTKVVSEMFVMLMWKRSCFCALPLHREYRRTRFLPWWLWSHRWYNHPSRLAPSMLSSNHKASIDRYAFARAKRTSMGLDLHLLGMAVACPFSIKLTLLQMIHRKKTKDTCAFCFYQNNFDISLIQFEPNSPPCKTK